MTDLEQDYLIEQAKVRKLEDRIFERERQLRKMTDKFEHADAACKQMKLDMQNISLICSEFQECGPFEDAEALRRVLTIKALADNYAADTPKN